MWTPKQQITSEEHHTLMQVRIWHVCAQFRLHGAVVPRLQVKVPASDTSIAWMRAPRYGQGRYRLKGVPGYG
jgi:hypothetical protein